MGADTPLVKKKDERNLMQMTIKDRGYRLGCRPGKQGPRPQSSDRSWVEKLGIPRRERSTATKDCKVQTHNWNMHECEGQVGDRAAGAAEKKMTVYRYDILGLAEMRWTGSGDLNNGEVIWSGEEKNHQRGWDFC